MRSAYSTFMSLYVILLCLSVLWLLLSSFNAVFTALFGLFWASLGAAVLLWIIEMRDDGDASSSNDSLPDTLLHNQTRQKQKQSIHKSFNTFNGVNGLCLALLVITICIRIFISVYPQTHDDIVNLENLMNDFFNHHKDIHREISLQNINALALIMHEISFFLLILISTTLGQTFVHISRRAKALLWISILLFMFSILKANLHSNVAVMDISLPLYGYGVSSHELLLNMGIIKTEALSSFQMRAISYGWLGSVFIYAVGGILLFSMGLRLNKSQQERNSFLSALLIISLMIYADWNFVAGQHLWGVWLSGWVSLAILNVNVHSRYKKVYHLYQ